jgi:hypothetical protein
LKYLKINMAIGRFDFEAIDSLDFRDRLGTLRTVYGCSTWGKKEFDDRLRLLQKHLAESEALTIGQLYREDEYFRYNCDRCLALNNIEPDWLTESMLVGMLFVSNGQPGLLIQLNAPDVQSVAPAGEKGATPEDLVAALWAHTQDLEKALAIASNPAYPVKQVVKIMESRSSLAEEALADTDPSEYHRRRLAKMRRTRFQQTPNTAKEQRQASSLSNLFKVMQTVESTKNQP